MSLPNGGWAALTGHHGHRGMLFILQARFACSIPSNGLITRSVMATLRLHVLANVATRAESTTYRPMALGARFCVAHRSDHLADHQETKAAYLPGTTAGNRK